MSNASNDLAVTLNNIAFWINRISPIIIIILGTFGNSFNIIIFSRRSLRINPCSMYFLAGSIANFFVMYVALLTRYLATSWNIDPSATNLIWCKIRYFLIYPALSLALWFIVLASLDRYFSSSHQIHIRQLSTLPRARKFIIVLTVFMFLINAHVIIFARTEMIVGVPTCTIVPDEYLVFFNIFVPIVSCLLPLVLMGVFGILTIAHIRTSRNRVARQDNHVPHERLRSNDRQLLVMLLCQILIATLIVAPWALINMFSAIGITIFKYKLSANGSNIYNFCFNVFRILYYMNPVLGFYIYTLSGARFRTEMKDCTLYGLKSIFSSIGLIPFLPLRIQRMLLNDNPGTVITNSLMQRRRGGNLVHPY